MEIDTKGCSVFVTGLLVLLAIAAIVVFVAPALDRAATNRDYAAADRERAEASRIQAQTELAAQRSANWQHEFMLWTAFLELNDDDLLLFALLVILILGIAAYTIGQLIGRRV